MANAQQTRAEQPSWYFSEAGNYPVALIVKNQWGCTDSVLKVVNVAEDFHIYVPNAFTPNGDDRNDYFLPVGRGLKTFNMKVFDRWGELLFESSDLSKGWDGTFKGMPAKTDVYVWKVAAVSAKGETKTMDGHVTLLR